MQETKKIEKEARQQAAEKARKYRDTKKIAEEAISIRTKLQEFQDAIGNNKRPDHDYASQMNELLVARSKQMMQEGMNWFLVDENPDEVSFSLSDVKELMTDLATKTRMLIYLSASRVSL